MSGKFRDSRIFLNFTCHKAKYLKIHWPFTKLCCNFVITWWPKTGNHWSWISSHCILEAQVKTPFKNTKTENMF